MERERKRLRQQERNRRYRRRRLEEGNIHVSDSEASSESDAGGENADLRAAAEAAESEAEDQNSSEADGDQDDEHMDQAVGDGGDLEVEDDQPEHQLNNSADSSNDENSSDQPEQNSADSSDDEHLSEQLQQSSADSGSGEGDSAESAMSQGETGSSESDNNDESGEEVEEHANSEESEIGSEEEREENEDRNEPIYPGAPITLVESLLAIFTFMTTQNVSGSLLHHVLQLIALHCPDGSAIKKTLKTFKSYFLRIGSSFLVKHFYCSNCIYPLRTQASVCNKCKRSGENATFFIELPLLQQLQSFFNKDSFFQDLQFRFKENRKVSQENIEDIYDGSIYKDEMDNGFLQNPNNLSFMWYSDGIKIFKSASFSVWPLCLVINELPYKKRSHPDNILLIGLWFGESKPNPNIFLRPLLKTMKKFESDGHVFRLPNDRDILVKGKILCGTCDLPAKAKFLQFKQYNGAFGCARCMQEGARAAAGRTTVQVYPYEPAVPLRTHEQTKQFAAEALEARRRNRNASVNGVKGPSLITRLVPDIIRCTMVDVMHGCFLGVARLLVDLIFSSSFSTQPWSLHHLFDVADEKLKKIKPPNYAARAPRSLKEIKFWKASEYKLFLLYYSVALFNGLMENRYLQHHCKLVSAIALLCQDSISLGQVDLASNLLRSYVQDFSVLYSIRYLGINVHQLLHLSDCVTDLGPLWVYSCFYLENYNGTLNKLCHGTQHIALQMCSAVSMLIQMPSFMKSLPPDSNVIQYCAKLTNNFKPFKISDVIDNCIYAVGHYYGERRQIDHSRLILRQCFNLVAGSCKIFYRLKLKGVMYFSKEYPICSTRNESSFVKISEGHQVHFGRVLRFVRWANCGDLCDVDCNNCPFMFYAIVAVMQREFWFAHDMRDVRFPYIFKVSQTDTVRAFNVNSITSLCFCFDVNDETFLCSPINRLECE